MIAGSQRSGEPHAGGSHARQHSTSRSATPPAAHHANVIGPVIFQYDWSGGKRAVHSWRSGASRRRVMKLPAEARRRMSRRTGHSLWQFETLHRQRGRILWLSIFSLEGFH